VIAEKQQDPFAIMLKDDASESMMARVGMWNGVMQSGWRNPKDTLFGIGPNVNLIRQRDASVFDDDPFEVGGDRIISYHNFYIDVLFQMGIVFCFCLVVMMFSTLKSLLRGLQHNGFLDPLALDCVFCIVAFLLAGLVTGASWGKPYVFVAEIFAISHLLIAGRLGSVLPNVVTRVAGGRHEFKSARAVG
jgi:hypothetical protein